jgi:hypothetical protein
MALASISEDTIECSPYLPVKVLNVMGTINVVGEKLARSRLNLVTTRGKNLQDYLKPKDLGYVRYDTALKDIDDAVLKCKRQDIPLFLMGHSMVNTNQSMCY